MPKPPAPNSFASFRADKTRHQRKQGHYLQKMFPVGIIQVKKSLSENPKMQAVRYSIPTYKEQDQMTNPPLYTIL